MSSANELNKEEENNHNSSGDDDITNYGGPNYLLLLSLVPLHLLGNPKSKNSVPI